MKALDLDSKTLIQEIDAVINDAILLLEGFLSDRNHAQVAHLVEVVADMLDLRKRLDGDLRRQRSKQGRSGR